MIPVRTYKPSPAYLQYAALVHAFTAKQQAEDHYAALLNAAPITIRERFRRWRNDKWVQRLNAPVEDSIPTPPATHVHMFDYTKQCCDDNEHYYPCIVNGCTAHEYYSRHLDGDPYCPQKIRRLW